MSYLRRKLPPLGSLVAFDAAARLGSFTRAADEIALSQASVSRRIRQLEDDLGVELFHRHRHDVTLTEAGSRLATTVQGTLRELASAAEALRLASSTPPHYTIYTDISLAGSLVNPLLPALQQAFPARQFRVMSSFVPIEQAADEFDLGLQVGRAAEERFRVESIADDRVFPVCSPGFLSDLPTRLSPADLPRHKLLHVDYGDRDWPGWRQFLAHHRIREPRPETGLVFGSYLVCLDMAARGAGIALGWGLSVKSMIDSGQLVRIPDMDLPFPDGICACRPQGPRPDPIADRIIELIRRQLQQDQAEAG